MDAPGPVLRRKRIRIDSSELGESSRSYGQPEFEPPAENSLLSTPQNSALPNAVSLSSEEDRVERVIPAPGSSQTLSEQGVPELRGDASQSNSGAAVFGPTTDNIISATRTSDVSPRPPDVAISNVQSEFGDATTTVISNVENVPSAEDFWPEKETSNNSVRRQAMEFSSAGAQDVQSNQGDATTCPICMEPWTGIGTHRICCLACGHLFGRSCIRRWLKQAGKKNAKCPHCNRKARIEDIRTLYVPFISAVEGESQQVLEELGALRIKNQELVAQNERLNREFHRLQGLLAALSSDYCRGSNRARMEKPQCLDFREEFNHQPHHLHPRDELRSMETVFCSLPSNQNIKDYSMMESTSSWNQRINCGSFHNTVKVPHINISGKYAFDRGVCHHNNLFCGMEICDSQNYFQLQDELPLPGARVFDMDAFSQMLLVAQKSSTLGNTCSLNKISMLSLLEAEVISLPPGTGAVRDIHIAPAGAKVPGRLALVASLGKRMSLVSLESNNVVLTYNLKSPSWSCAWDPYESNYVYTGLQDGSLVILDLRQTSSPLISVDGISRQPLHSLHPVNECNLPEGLRRKGILSACSSGIWFWDMTSSGIHGCRPCNVPHDDGGGVCVALAYNHISNVAVSTFRPKPCHQQSEAPTFSPTVESTALGMPSSQVVSQISSTIDALPATHFPMVRKDTAPSFGGQGCQNEEIVENITRLGMASSGINHFWKYDKPMLGYVSPVGMQRSAIVCCLRNENRSDFQNLFVFGDEATKALWLWDMRTLEVVDRLKAHQSPILDVKSVNIGDQTILGCTSSRTIQLYKTKKKAQHI